MMLVWDMGDTYGLTPFSSEFINDVSFDILGKDVNKVNMVIGIGTTLNKFIESNDQDILFPCISYQPTETYVCLFSPQPYHQTTGGQYLVQGNQVIMHLPFHSTHIHVDLGDTNLPVVHNSILTYHLNREISPQMLSSFAYSILSNIDAFSDINSIKYIQAMDISREKFSYLNDKSKLNYEPLVS